MASADFIPTGRTSLVKRADIKLQVQTEYAHRPVPRITTTILKSGQVVHKVERHLDSPITNLEQKNLTEDTIRKQHAEILAIIGKKGGLPGLIPELVPKPASPTPAAEPEDFEIIEFAAFTDPIDEEPEVSEETGASEASAPCDLYLPTPDPMLTIEEQLKNIPGIERVYRLDIHGKFHQSDFKSEFRKKFSAVFKSLGELLAVFTEMPGVGLNREQGVYEVERDRLYLVSSGVEFFICYVKQPRPEVNYEKAIHVLLPQQNVW